MNKYNEKRPWGNFERFTLNEKTTVKIINVSAGEETSLQTHKRRSEFWKVLDGSGIFVIGEVEKEGKRGDEFFVEKENKHQIKGGEGGVSLLEISFGEFDENDIERISDKYNR